VVTGLKGFGIEEFDEILTLKCEGKDWKIKIASIPTSDEILAAQEAGRNAPRQGYHGLDIPALRGEGCAGL
jgi:hypothetical protein